MTQPIRDYPVTHAWIRPVFHPRLKATVNGQSAVRYMRFLRPVKVERLELKPLVYGRWVPAVPTHPAHVTVSVPDWAMTDGATVPTVTTGEQAVAAGGSSAGSERQKGRTGRPPPRGMGEDGVAAGGSPAVDGGGVGADGPSAPMGMGEGSVAPRWRVVSDMELPRDPVAAGEGLNQAMPIEEMESRLRAGLERCHVIPLGGVETAILRVECDREHDVWPNHGECNGGVFNVPFGALNQLQAFGEAGGTDPVPPPYVPPLRVGDVKPAAPRGMKVEVRPDGVHFAGRRMSVAFSLRRPFIRHLGWDATKGGRQGENRLARQMHVMAGAGGLSGPFLKTFGADHGAHTWTGEVSVAGNQVIYRGLHCGTGVEIDAIFTVAADRIRMELTQRAAQAVPALEAFAWTLLWNEAAAMTGAAAVPVLKEGRNGEVALPMMWAGDGVGGLRCSRAPGVADSGRLQVESFRPSNAVQGGFVLGPYTDPGAVPRVPAGTFTGAWELAVDNLQPVSRGSSAKRGPAIERHWGSVFSCYRPEYGGFSNNAVSVNCHVNHHGPCELAAFTRRRRGGPDPLGMYRFTIGRALMDGGGYGYHRNLYLDSDPIVVSGAGRIHQANPDRRWLREIRPGLDEAVRRMLATLDDSGLAVCRALTGNTGSFRWSSNAMDIVGFGHYDAYVNAWTYRGLRNAAALLTACGDSGLAAQCGSAASALHRAFQGQFVNPETGWVAGWRSRDGKLHDAAYVWVNGPAIAFGLLDEPAARTALSGLEALRREVSAERAWFGLPFNLRPVPAGDHMLPRFMGPLSPTFEHYTDGSMGACGAPFYLRALQLYGLEAAASRLAEDLEEGYTRDYFNGGVGSGVEFLRWDGVPTGYEGTFVASFSALYPIAIGRGVIQPFEPEWWPKGG